MHIPDGVLSVPVVTTGLAATGAMTAYAVSRTRTSELPKISLLTGAFFVVSLVSLPLPGPTCVHPMLAALLGILLGSKAVIAVLVGLGLQAFLLQYGGISTLGINTLLVVVPALISAQGFVMLRSRMPTVLGRGALCGAVATILVGIFLAVVMYFSDERYGMGYFSLINFILFSHLVLGLVVEAPLTGFALRYLNKVRPSLIRATHLFTK